jgi:hypothetical protein
MLLLQKAEVVCHQVVL